ncbi:DHH phosphoesterase [Whalleya microplaca]|nr:DHH phosphoesterase [Whalleya microplaca]
MGSITSTPAIYIGCKMTPQKTLKAFLATARAALTAPPSNRSTPLHFVVGNESADLDSLCSALILAYFRTHTPPHTLHIPLCHLPRSDLALRPEFTAALAGASLAPDDVLTLSELPSPADLRPEDSRWLLVDHNAMTGDLGRVYGSAVVGCIDHHEDEGVVARGGAAVRVLEKSGSCMSLVLEHCREAWEALSREHGTEGNKEANAQLARLALAPILIDTSALGNRDKTTDHDERAVAIAEARVRVSDGEYDRGWFFCQLTKLKEDITGMSLGDVFRKDYKEWDEGPGAGARLKLGTSSVPQAFATLVHKAGGEGAFVAELEKWGALKEVDLVAVLTTSKEGDEKFRREMLVWARTGPEAVRAAKAFVRSHGEELGLGTWGDGKLDAEEGDTSWRRCWTQDRVENSRKQIAPMLRDALKENAKT